MLQKHNCKQYKKLIIQGIDANTRNRKKTLKDFQNNMLILQSGKKINFQIDKVDIGNIGDLNISRETIIFISGKNIFRIGMIG